MTPSHPDDFSVLLTPLRAALSAGQPNTVEVLVRIQAPDASASLKARPPQAIALVIDRSGSMDGRPLQEARRCAAFAVSRMRPIDSVSLVQFDDTVERLWPATALGALLSHITGDAEADSYQPMNVNFGLFPPVEGKMKKASRKQVYTARAKADFAEWTASAPL